MKLSVIIVLLVFCFSLPGYATSISPSGSNVTVPPTSQTVDQGCAGQYASLMQAYNDYLKALQSKIEELKLNQENVKDLQQQIKDEQAMINYYKNNPAAANANPGKYEQHLKNLQILQSKYNGAVYRYNGVQNDRARIIDKLNQLDNQIRAVIAKCESDGIKVGPPPKADLSTGTKSRPVSPRQPTRRFQQRKRPGGAGVTGTGTPVPGQGLPTDKWRGREPYQ